MNGSALRLVVAVLCTMLGAGAACAPSEPDPVTLKVLASSELADMRPLLDELRAETGVELVMDHRGTVAASDVLTAGDHDYDVAWLSSDRYFQLRLKASRRTGPRPLSRPIMRSPVVIGVKPATAKLLRQNAPGRKLSWADFADGAAAGVVNFGMADPNSAGSGLTALVGVATAAAGTGRALRLASIFHVAVCRAACKARKCLSCLEELGLLKVQFEPSGRHSVGEV